MSENVATVGSSAPVAAPAPVKRRYSYAELLAELPETNQPSELWDGELIMSPLHAGADRSVQIVAGF